MKKINLLHGDCLEQMKTLPDNSVDAIVTDPPYGISFMAKKWDYDVPSVEVWKEALRVLKHGGHALIACGTRTQHRMVVNIEDAGFEIRDVVSWIYGSGFPKSLDVSKAIDKMDASEAQLSRRYKFTEWVRSHNVKSEDISKATGTQMGGHYTTPASQPAIMTREHLEACRHLFADVPKWIEDECDKRSVESENFKRREVVGERKAVNTKKHRIACAVSAEGYDKMESHIIDITIPATDEAKQWDGWGTALKPACEFFTLARKPLSEKTVAANVLKWGTGGINIDGCRVGTGNGNPKPTYQPNDKNDVYGKNMGGGSWENTACRFPANLIHDGSQEVLELFPNSGDKSPSRFFYCAKASKKDRDEGLEGFEEKKSAGMAGNMVDGQRLGGDGNPIKTPMRKNNHPTVKPTDLMRYLCRLITPPNGVVLDPFMGSGSTGKAAMLEGFDFIGCELSEDYYKIAEKRITHAQNAES